MHCHWTGQDHPTDLKCTSRAGAEYYFPSPPQSRNSYTLTVDLFHLWSSYSKFSASRAVRTSWTSQCNKKTHATTRDQLHIKQTQAIKPHCNVRTSFIFIQQHNAIAKHVLLEHSSIKVILYRRKDVA